ncbi:MAG: DNA topoisomerase 3 [Myxococcota bacterium]
MSVVVVAEKPSVARDLARVLGARTRTDGALTGNGYVVTWAIGHLVGLEEPEGIDAQWRRWSFETLPMFPRRWPLRVFDNTRAQFELVRQALTARDVSEVICATDAGREGELIFRFIYEAAGCRKPVKRLWISSLTDDAIREGFARLRPQRDFDGLASAALGRSRADWLVGMNLSRAYGLTMDAQLSVGRVQTPTLAMLVERELAIRTFKPEDYLEVVATFSPREGVSYQGTWHRDGQVEHPKRLPVSGEEAAAIVARAKAGEAKVASVTSKQKKMPPPLLYDLTELQRHTNRLYGFSAQRTLELAQALYEQHKLISYPRTDSRHLSSEVARTLGPIAQVIAPLFQPHVAPGTGDRPLSRRFVDDAQVSDHHAIIPTATSPQGRTLSVDERRVYELICRRLLQAWHDDFVWAATEVVTEVASPGVVDRYRSHGTAIEQPGWKVLDVGAMKAPAEKRAPGEEDDDAALPGGLVKGQPQRVLDAKAVQKRTRPPPRLTDATLLTAMETAGKTLDERELSEAMKENGLGTPATRANIIETLLTRGYIVREGKSLAVTEKGLGLIEVVDPEVKSAAMTGAWEARLQRIAKGQGELPEFIEGIERYVESVIGRLRNGGAPPPSGRPPPQSPPRAWPVRSVADERRGPMEGRPASSTGADRGSPSDQWNRSSASVDQLGARADRRRTTSAAEGSFSAPPSAASVEGNRSRAVVTPPGGRSVGATAPPQSLNSERERSSSERSASVTPPPARRVSPERPRSSSEHSASVTPPVARSVSAEWNPAPGLSPERPRPSSERSASVTPPAERSVSAEWNPAPGLSPERPRSPSELGAASGAVDGLLAATTERRSAAAPVFMPGARREPHAVTGGALTPAREKQLLSRFGHASFRPHQRDACAASIAGDDVLLVMPTGAGKSLCYQLPGLARGGTTLVVSPLIALMEDQVSRLQALGLRAERIHSGRGRPESRRVCAEYLAGQLDYLFIAPERLGVPGFPELLARKKPALIAIDEAHCISQWGHDFRPDYRLLGERLPLLRPAPVMALTATATPRVQADIVAQLGLRGGAKQLIHGFRRDNLAIECLEVLPKERPARALDWLLQAGRLPAIVYAATRKSAEQTAEFLSRRLRAAPYHAGLSTEERDATQSRFLGGQLDVVVATVAFGMGVDKADVRTVLHLALPGSVEGYYQEIGRAGRDGKPSRAVLMHHFVDRKTHEFFLERDYPDAAVLAKVARALDDTPQDAEAVRRRARVKVDDFEKALEKLWIHGGVRGVTEDQLTRGHDDWQAPYAEQRALKVEQLALMARFAEGHRCRMLALVQHFGDRSDTGAPCGLCDVCRPEACIAARFEAPTSREVTLLTELLERLRTQPGQAAGRLCRELLGDAPEHRREFERLVGGLVRAGQLRVEDAVFEKDGRRIPWQRLFVVGTGDAQRARLVPKTLPPPEHGERLGRRRKGRTARASREPVELPEAGEGSALVVKLRSWRLQEAKRRRVPAFRVLTNRALLAVAEARPTTPQALRAVKGLGPKTLKDWGDQLVALCRD